MTKADLARKLLKKYPKSPIRTLAKRLYEDNRIQFDSIESARTSLRYAAGRKGEQHRKNASSADPTTVKERVAPPSIPSIPPSKATDWKHFRIAGPAVVLSIADVHIPYHDPAAVESALAFAESEHAVTHVLLNGDIADFYTVSKWEKDPKKRDLRAEVSGVRDFLRHIVARFPTQPIIYKKGNHEERWDHWLWRQAAELWDFPQCRMERAVITDDDGDVVDELRRVEFVGQQGCVFVGKLPVFHGHELPKGLTNPVNQARGAFLRTNASTLTAHGHQTSSQPHPTWDKQEQFSWSQGCLCHMHPEYARINKWNHGFAVIEIDKAGDYDVYNYRLSGEYKVRSS